MEQEQIAFLFEKYLRDAISDNERQQLFEYIRHARQEDFLKNQFMQVFREKYAEEKDVEQVDWEKMFAEITETDHLKTGKGKIRRMLSSRNVAAAVAILLLGTAGLYFLRHKEMPAGPIAETAKTKVDVLPGGYKATLTLSNGQTISLDQMHKGKLASQKGVNVVKEDSSLLAYQPVSMKNADAEVQYNTLTTPRGGQYQLTLSDGTKVWLNAASSIHYPAAFTGKKREVEITGEVYFEVVHNPSAPFKVKAGNMVVEDLGTHFDINAYSDDAAVKTTLLEGSVKIGKTVLSPGQQAVEDKDGHMRVVNDINTNDVIAWKDGFFSFRNDKLQTVMKKLSRWYDIDVTYNAGVNNQQTFSGRIDRNLKLSQVLKGLEQTNAHFKIEDNHKVEILP